MVRCLFQWVLLAGLIQSFSLAHAQSLAVEQSAAPQSTASATYPFFYRSVFTHYQLFKEQPVFPWRDANDQVGTIGGWRFYAREAERPDAEEASTEPNSADQVTAPLGPPINAGQHSEQGRKP